MSEIQRVSVRRFIARLDACFDHNDLRAARETIAAWEQEARALGDDRGLLSVLNEAVGFYRRTQKKGKALAAMGECLSWLTGWACKTSFPEPRCTSTRHHPELFRPGGGQPGPV